jgi:hypothetical protein
MKNPYISSTHCNQLEKKKDIYKLCTDKCMLVINMYLIIYAKYFLLSDSYFYFIYRLLQMSL